MIYLIFSVSCTLCYLAHILKKHLEIEENTKDAFYAFVTNVFEILVPLTAVTFLYSIFAYSLSDMGSDQVTVEALRKYEKRIQEVQGWLTYIKLNSVHSFLLLIIWFFVAMIVRIRLSPRASERLEKVYAKYESYDKWLKRVSSVVVLLASFTFFGSMVDSLGGELQVRIKTMSGNYNTFAKQVERAVEASVADGIHKKIESSAPPAYLTLKVFSSRVWEQFAVAAGKYDSTKDHYYIYESPSLNALVNEARKREDHFATVINEADKLLSQTARPVPLLELPASQLNQSQLSMLNEVVMQHLSSLAARAEPILQTPLGKKIVPGVLGLLITHGNIGTLESLASDIPILKMILPLFSKVLNKNMEIKINQTVRRLAQKAVTTPNLNVVSEIDREAREIVQETVVDWGEIKPETFTAIEAALKTDERTISAERKRVTEENRLLYEQVKNRWGSLLMKGEAHGVNYVYSRLDSDIRRKLSPDQFRTEIDQLFQKFAGQTMSISEPFEQQAKLRNILNVLPGKGQLDEAIAGLALLGASDFSKLRETYDQEPSPRTGHGQSPTDRPRDRPVERPPVHPPIRR